MAICVKCSDKLIPGQKLCPRCHKAQPVQKWNPPEERPKGLNLLFLELPTGNQCLYWSEGDRQWRLESGTDQYQGYLTNAECDETANDTRMGLMSAVRKHKGCRQLMAISYKYSRYHQWLAFDRFCGDMDMLRFLQPLSPLCFHLTNGYGLGRTDNLIEKETASHFLTEYDDYLVVFGDSQMDLPVYQAVEKEKEISQLAFGLAEVGPWVIDFSNFAANIKSSIHKPHEKSQAILQARIKSLENENKNLKDSDKQIGVSGAKRKKR